MHTVVILCGGRGTRMRSSAETLPKPLVEIGDKPILWHVMSLYAAQGMRRFVLLLGHGADRVESFASGLGESWEVTCVRTGLDTPTGGRLRRARTLLEGQTICLTYADGLADIDLWQLARFHAGHPGLVTMTVARPRNPWGIADVAPDGRVRSFAEKRRLPAWVNAGFFFMEPGAFEFLTADEPLEQGPLESLAAVQELYAFRHEGFWACMDTYKDTVALNDLWSRGEAPWSALERVS